MVAFLGGVMQGRSGAWAEEVDHQARYMTIEAVSAVESLVCQETQTGHFRLLPPRSLLKCMSRHNQGQKLTPRRPCYQTGIGTASPGLFLLGILPQ